MNVPPQVVILGIGNTLMQDDGIGVYAIQALAHTYILPDNVCLVEGGIAGLRLLSDLSGADYLLIIDAVEGTGPPGTLYQLNPQDLPKGRGFFMSAHEIGIAEVLSMAEFLGKLPQTCIIGVQPLEARKIGLELTPPLQEALPRVVAAVVGELQELGVQVIRKTDTVLCMNSPLHKEL
jgi:hydrogenase maturation protease